MSYVSVRLGKLAKRAETTRNYQKQVLVMINHCLANSKILLDTGVNSFLTELFSAEQTQKFSRVTSWRADFIHSQHEVKENLDPEKHTFSI